ncbi:hypothetical protein [Acinetobacter sp. NigerLNRRAM0016]
MMSIKKIREAALIQKQCEISHSVDHKAKFTEQQLEKMGYFVVEAIEKICIAVKNDPSTKHSEQMYIANKNWSDSKTDSYITLCNEEIMHAGYQNELVAVLMTFDQRGNPNAYCAEENLIQHFVCIKER